MATVNFYLKGAISKNNIQELLATNKSELNEQLNRQLQIFLKVSMAGRRIQIYTKRRISQNLWQKDKQEANCRKMKIGCIEFNEWLDELKIKVLKRCAELENKKKWLTKQELAKLLGDKIINRDQSNNFIDLKNFYLREQKTPSGYPLKLTSQKKYESLVNHLENFCTEKHISPEFGNVDVSFLENFKEYLSTEVKLSDNTASKYIKQTKTYFGFFIKQEFLQPIDFSRVKSPEKEGNIIVLQLNQILHLQELKEIQDPELIKARDVFCFMCWTGQRYSDISVIKREDIYINADGQKIWDLNVQKTGERISVPIIEYADQVLKKYKDFIYPLPRIYNQKMNDQLKIIGRIAKFKDPIKIVKYYNGEKQEKYEPLHQHLTTHVARKSYITNSLMLGIPERVVREVSGHKDDKSFRRYINLAESYRNKVIKDAYSKENITKFL